VIKLRPPVPTAPRSLPTTVRQLSIAFDSIPLRAMSPTERARVLTQLARLLMLAAGVVKAERDDDEH
jgi:hypothetical protein